MQPESGLPRGPAALRAAEETYPGFGMSEMSKCQEMSKHFLIQIQAMKNFKGLA